MAMTVNTAMILRMVMNIISISISITTVIILIIIIYHHNS